MGVYVWFGSDRALELLTGYVIEKALSVDNLFVFIVVFSAFAVPPKSSTACCSGGSSARSSCARSSVDSILAIFAVTTDPFIVYTLNIFAILGLRALYFAGMMDKYHYLKVGLSLVLMFVGAKMLLAGIYKISLLTSLAVIAAVIGGSIVASLLRRPTATPAPG